MVSRARIIPVALALATLMGCSLFIEGLEEGRPCKDGRCPHTFVCVDDICVSGSEPVETACSEDADCECAVGTGMCDVEGNCRCLSLSGVFEGTGETEPRGRFDLEGGSINTTECAFGAETYAICGGLAR